MEWFTSQCCGTKARGVNVGGCGRVEHPQRNFKVGLKIDYTWSENVNNIV